MQLQPWEIIMRWQGNWNAVWTLGLAAWMAAIGCNSNGRSPDVAEGGSEAEAEIIEVEGLTGLTGSVAVDGSSTVYPVTEAVAEEFQTATEDKVKVTVGISGTGGGFKKFARKETDVSNASRPILKEEMEAAKEAGIEFIELPVCFDALTIAVHPENDWCDSITIDELKKIWEPEAEGKIMKWSQVREGWPDEDMKLFGAGTDSGTFDYFTEAVVGKAKSSRGDFTPSEDDNTLVTGIHGNPNALGYIPYAYFEPNKSRLKAVKVIPAGKTEGIEPSAENVISGAYTPLSRPLFLYVSKQSAERLEVKKFVEFYLANAATLAEEVQYVPLPEAAYGMAKERFAKLQTGSGFGGVPEVGLAIEEILKRTPTN